MKKTITIIATLIILNLLILTSQVYAVTLDDIAVGTDKTTVRPGEEVSLTITFGQSLGAYTFNIAYDNNIFEYVSVDGGTANDTTDEVKVVFYDTTGGSNPRDNMTITFRAKDDLTTSNPTELTVTGEGLANADASVTYDDITTPIVKNLTVEPEYVDYTFDLTYTGEIVKEEEKDMVLSYSSSIGRYYEHARLIATATAPTGASVQLIGTDEENLEHDIIQSGWGDAQGYAIGGKDVSQVLNVRGIFSDAGDYTITLQLIDRDNSDDVIAEKTFNFTVLSEATTTDSKDEEEPTETDDSNSENAETEEAEEPTTLPSTGIDVYMQIAGVLIALAVLFIIIKSRKEDKE